MRSPASKAGLRYLTNLVQMEARQRSWPSAFSAGARFIFTELLKLPKFAKLIVYRRLGRYRAPSRPPAYSPSLLQSLGGLGVAVIPFRIDPEAFWRHVHSCEYPANYAAGPVDEGGAREKKLMEYFVSLELLHPEWTDVVIDVASERSIFPEVLRRLTRATVFRQDLIYRPGVNGDRIGGNAAHMPVPAAFADKLVLHNSFEHFEGSADLDFIAEARRVLRPGGIVCIAPLFMSEEYHILTDPLVDRRGIVWDEGARIVEQPWWHNRFGRFYDAAALRSRVLAPAERVGFTPTIYHFANVQEIHPSASMHFALVLRAPEFPAPESLDREPSAAAKRVPASARR